MSSSLIFDYWSIIWALENKSFTVSIYYCGPRLFGQLVKLETAVLSATILSSLLLEQFNIQGTYVVGKYL